MINENNQEYKHWRHNVGFQKFPEYIEYVHERFPGENIDVHHLLGSESKRKKHTDALVYPFDHDEHINKAEKNKAKYFNDYLVSSVQLFNDWTMLKYDKFFPLDRLDPVLFNQYLDELKKDLQNG
jgi:hypothetical protein